MYFQSVTNCLLLIVSGISVGVCEFGAAFTISRVYNSGLLSNRVCPPDKTDDSSVVLALLNHVVPIHALFTLTC